MTLPTHYILHVDDQMQLASMPGLVALALQHQTRDYNIVEEGNGPETRLLLSRQKDGSPLMEVRYCLVATLDDYTGRLLQIPQDSILYAVFDEPPQTDIHHPFCFYTAFPKRIRRALGWSVDDPRLLLRPNDHNRLAERLAGAVRNAAIEREHIVAGLPMAAEFATGKVTIRLISDYGESIQIEDANGKIIATERLTDDGRADTGGIMKAFELTLRALGYEADLFNMYRDSDLMVLELRRR